jgi:MFS family permease
MPETPGAFRFDLSFLLKCMVAIILSIGVAWLAQQKANLADVPAACIGSCMLGIIIYALVQLRGSPLELTYTFGLKFLTVTAYKILNFTLVLWLTKDLGFSKTDALSIVTVWAIMMSITNILAGSITDAVGLRKTLMVGMTLCVACRLAMVICPNKWMALGLGLIPTAIGESLCTPVLVAALRRYTRPSQRSVAFSLFYALMNFGFMVGYFISDAVTKKVHAMPGGHIQLLGSLASDRQALIFVSLLLDLLMLPLILVMRTGTQMGESGLEPRAEPKAYPDAGFFQSLILTFKDGGKNAVTLFIELAQSVNFRRLLVFLLMIGFLKIVFNAMDYALPTFAKQELGEAAPVGQFNAVNSILILLMAPAVGIATRKFSAYGMVIVGGFITALSFIFVALPPSTFDGITHGVLGDWIGRGYFSLKGSVHPYYVTIVLWQVVFSIGESFYSPRVYEYASSIAPRGQEASYASLSYIPLLIGKLVSGSSFGWLLEKYCPDQGARSPETMWQIIAALVLIAPIGLLLLRNYIRVPEEGK